MHMTECTNPSFKGPLSSALKSSTPNLAGRSYALPNCTLKVRKRNLIGKNGKVMLCRKCDSPEHFIRDCQIAKLRDSETLIRRLRFSIMMVPGLIKYKSLK